MDFAGFVPPALRLFLHPRATVVFCDERGLVAVEKPPGVLSHPNGPALDRRALLGVPYDMSQRAYVPGEGFSNIFLLNRLDEPTGGLVLLSMGPAVAAAVRRAFAAGAVAKTYFAFVRQGRLLGKERWSDGMEKIYKEGKLRAIKSDLRRALTDVIFRGGRRFGTYPLALLELRPITGRTHQLRFQCARHSFPILGDRTYGDFSFNRSVAGTLGCKGLQLHGAKISLRYGLNGHTHVFAADSPKAEIFTNWEKFSKVLPKNF